MKLIVRLFTCVSPASDGSRVPRGKVEEYLSSDSYKNAINSGTMLCTVSHRDRQVSASQGGDLLKGVVGRDDQILLNKSAVGKLTKIFFSDDHSDEWVYGEVELFNEELMDSQSAELIRQIKGLIRNGVKLTTSTILVCYWDENEVCEKFVACKGNDFTLNPAFNKGGQEPAGVIKVIED